LAQRGLNHSTTEDCSHSNGSALIDIKTSSDIPSALVQFVAHNGTFVGEARAGR
jgi:hypothetical protein